MKLLFDLPEKEKAAFDGAVGVGEKLMYCVPFNILEDKFVNGFIAITNQRIYKILDDKLLEVYEIAGATGFKTEVEFLPMTDYFFHYRVNLIHLDRINDEVLPFIPVFFCCL